MNIANHTCIELSSSRCNSDDQKTSITREDGAWFFKIEEFADKEMVADGEADYEGEEIFSSGMLIKYCPFCGLELD